MNRTVLLASIGPSKPPRPPLIPRAPLPPFPQPMTYEHTAPPRPAGPDLYYYRGNFCGIRVPGAPVVPGSNASNPECVMACLLDNYPADVQKEYLRLYAGYGYTHLQRSVGHALGYGHSLKDYIDLTRRAQDYGLFADHWLIAEESPGFEWNADASHWGPILDPIMDQLVATGTIDSCCVAWQLDKINRDAPGNATISVIAHVANHLPSSVPVYTHWINEALAWWKTGGEVWFDPLKWPNGILVSDRFTWWQCMQPYLTGGYHQGDTTLAWNDPTTYQGKMRDTLNPFTNGRMGQSRRLPGAPQDFRLVVFECTGQDQFDGKRTEDEGDLTGYILACTTSDGNHVPVSGYGNGARLPDGSPM